MEHLKILAIGLGRAIISIIFLMISILPLYIFDHYTPHNYWPLLIYVIPLFYWLGSLE